MKLIFLDIDGVLNHESYYKNRPSEHRDEFGELFCPNASLFINELIKLNEAKIVISSTWRGSGLKVMQEMWQARKMNGEVIGITPHLDHRFRGLEIKAYLKDKHGFYHLNWNEQQQLDIMKSSKIENYIIIDDDSDMTYTQRNHFIHVLPSPRNKEGFNKEYFVKANQVLKQDIIELNYN